VKSHDVHANILNKYLDKSQCWIQVMLEYMV